MVSFEKVFLDHSFSFNENELSDEVYFNIAVDIYTFKMIPGEAGWKILGDVPPWILSIEDTLSDVIDNELE